MTAKHSNGSCENILTSSKGSSQERQFLWCIGKQLKRKKRNGMRESHRSKLDSRRYTVLLFSSDAEEKSFVVILRPTARGDGRRIRLVFGVLVIRKTKTFLAPTSPNMDLGQANEIRQSIAPSTPGLPGLGRCVQLFQHAYVKDFATVPCYVCLLWFLDRQLDRIDLKLGCVTSQRLEPLGPQLLLLPLPVVVLPKRSALRFELVLQVLWPSRVGVHCYA